MEGRSACKQAPAWAYTYSKVMPGGHRGTNLEGLWDFVYIREVEAFLSSIVRVWRLLATNGASHEDQRGQKCFHNGSGLSGITPDGAFPFMRDGSDPPEHVGAVGEFTPAALFRPLDGMLHAVAEKPGGATTGETIDGVHSAVRTSTRTVPAHWWQN